MKNLAFIFIFLILSSMVYGQKEITIEKNDTTSHWEVGLDLLWLINKNQVPSTSVFGRYNFVKSSGGKRALRLRLGFNTSLYDSAQSVDPANNEVHIFSPYFRPGFEWQKTITRGASYFYGIDLYGQYFQSKTKRVLYSSFPQVDLYQETDKVWEIGAVGFIGLKYRPTKWLALSAESALNFIYKIRKERDKVTDINYPDSVGGTSQIDVHNFQIQFQPITVVNLSFYLN